MWRLLSKAAVLRSAQEWDSSEWVESRAMPGVRMRIARISFSRRIDLLKRLRSLLPELEYRTAGEKDIDRAEAARLNLEVQRLYVEWGLLAVEGLTIDGTPATKESLLSHGPEQLCEEAAEAVRSRTFLSAEERKN